MTMIAQEHPTDAVLIVIRGNSGSGKSAIARELRERYGWGLAIVAQDVVRRQMLREHDVPGGANIGLIDLTVRYALDHGFSTVLEGILNADHYGAMLRGLQRDYAARSHWYYLDIPLDETLRRHATKPEAGEFGEVQLRRWYRAQDLVRDFPERIITADVSLEAACARIIVESALLDRVVASGV